MLLIMRDDGCPRASVQSHVSRTKAAASPKTRQQQHSKRSGLHVTEGVDKSASRRTRAGAAAVTHLECPSPVIARLAGAAGACVNLQTASVMLRSHASGRHSHNALQA